MLLQSHDGVIDLLPALPTAWDKGYVKGLRARGGFELDMTWDDGRLETATVKSLLGSPCYIRHGSLAREFDIEKGETIRLDHSLK
jgi:alpha-L-fucosidase 2